MSVAQSLFINSEVVLDGEVVEEIAHYLTEHPTSCAITRLYVTSGGMIHRFHGLDSAAPMAADPYVMWGHQ